MAGVQGMVHSRPKTDVHKDAALRSRIENRLRKHFDGEERLTQTQLKAGELLYARLRPVLSAVEQTVTDARDNLSEDQLLAQLCALFAAKPDLFKRIVEIQSAAALVHESASVVEHARSGAMHSDAQRASVVATACDASSSRTREQAATESVQDATGVEPPRKNA